MRNTYVKCANWTWEEKLLYIKACIGEDIPHSKICGNASYKKSDLLETYKNVAAYIYCYSNGMISFDEERDGVNPSKNHGVEVNLSELKPKQEKPKPTKFVKVEESIFDLKGEFERGKLYSSNCEGHYTQLKYKKSLYLAAHQDSVYRQVEIDWRDELDSYLDSISSLDGNFDEKVTLEFSKSKFSYNMSDSEFVAVCHLVASLTEKPEQGVGMSSNIERMKVEHKELKEKCEALGAFIYGNKIFNSLCNLEQARMTKQLGFMDAYLRVLESRIWAAIDE